MTLKTELVEHTTLGNESYSPVAVYDEEKRKNIINRLVKKSLDFFPNLRRAEDYLIQLDRFSEQVFVKTVRNDFEEYGRSNLPNRRRMLTEASFMLGILSNVNPEEIKEDFPELYQQVTHIRTLDPDRNIKVLKIVEEHLTGLGFQRNDPEVKKVFEQIKRDTLRGVFAVAGLSYVVDALLLYYLPPLRPFLIPIESGVIGQVFGVGSPIRLALLSRRTHSLYKEMKENKNVNWKKLIGLNLFVSLGAMGPVSGKIAAARNAHMEFLLDEYGIAVFHMIQKKIGRYDRRDEAEFMLENYYSKTTAFPPIGF